MTTLATPLALSLLAARIQMTESCQVAVEPALRRDAEAVANLLELYSHDLSAAFSLELGPDGRFGYERLPLYWSEPDRRFPFLVRRGHLLAGFALVTRGSPASDDPTVFDVAEFFVVRRDRRCGVGRRAAFVLWSRFAARWIVRVSEDNHRGCHFWESVVAEYTSGVFLETRRSDGQRKWRVFEFSSAIQSTPA
jgi:predicted acetyltransferase